MKPYHEIPKQLQVLVSLPTAHIIAELKRRKPDCKKCHVKFPEQYFCLSCVWYYFGEADLENLYVEVPRNETDKKRA